MTIEEQVTNAELLLEFAVENKLALPPADVAVLRAARAKLPNLSNPGPSYDAFTLSLSNIVSVLPISAADLRAAWLRRTRLKPLTDDSQSLLAYAASNAKKIDDENRKALIAFLKTL